MFPHTWYELRVISSIRSEKEAAPPFTVAVTYGKWFCKQNMHTCYHIGWVKSCILCPVVLAMRASGQNVNVTHDKKLDEKPKLTHPNKSTMMPCITCICVHHRLWTYSCWKRPEHRATDTFTTLRVTPKQNEADHTGHLYSKVHIVGSRFEFL